MRIWHAETKEDFDYLMLKLEKEGCVWVSGNKPTDGTTNQIQFHLQKGNLCICERERGLIWFPLSEYEEKYLHIGFSPIY